MFFCLLQLNEYRLLSYVKTASTALLDWEPPTMYESPQMPLWTSDSHPTWWLSWHIATPELLTVASELFNSKLYLRTHSTIWKFYRPVMDNSHQELMRMVALTVAYGYCKCLWKIPKNTKYYFGLFVIF